MVKLQVELGKGQAVHVPFVACRLEPRAIIENSQYGLYLYDYRLFWAELTETNPNKSILILIKKSISLIVFLYTPSLFQYYYFLCEYNIFLSIKENSTTLLLCLLLTNN